MQIVVPINPTTVNVLTDLFLTVLQLLWGRAMMTLTAADIRRSLRLGAPLPTYEHLGTDRYCRVSFSNYQRNKASLESTDKRWFRWSILKGLAALLITAGMVALHLVIDLGLDFDTQMKLTNTTQTYAMVGFQNNSEYLEHLRQYTVIKSGGLDAVQEQCKQLTSRECRQVARDADDYRTSRIFEGVSFSKMLYTESLLGSVDVLEELTFDYRPLRVPVGDKKEDFPECHVEEERDLEDFRGSWRLSHSGCALSEVRMKNVIIDMRARAAFQRSLSDESAGVRFEREYNSFENFKDVNMTATKSSVQTLEVPDVEQLEPGLKTMQRARLTVDSGVRYLPGEQQRINITNLASTDEKRNFKPVLWRSDPVEVAGDEPSDILCAGERGTMTEFENSSVRFGGEECAHDVLRGMGKCSKIETPFVYYNSYTSMHQVFVSSADADHGEESKLISDICVDLAFDEFFGGQTSDESSSIKRYLYLGSLMESVCAVRETEDGRFEKMCAIGAEYMRWDGSEWSEVAAEDFNNSTDIQLVQKVTAVSIEITGGDPSQIRDAVENIASILSGADYANFKWFTAGPTSPRRIFGVNPQHGSKAFLSAMATQIGATNRTVYVYEPVQVSVLKGAYVYTIAVLIVVTLAALVISILRKAQESRLSRKSLLAEKDIPLSRTDWVQFVLKLLNEGSAEKAADSAIYSYEYTSRLEEPDLEEKGTREEGDRPTGKIGFFKGPEPLKAGVDYK